MATPTSSLPTKKTDRTAPPPVEREVTGAEFLKLLLPSATDEDLEAVGRAWNIAQNEIDSIKSLPPTDSNEEALNREIRIAITAAQAEAATNKHGRVTTGAILNATPEQLTTWAETYENNLHGNYQEQITVNAKLARLEGTDLQDSREWLELRAELLELREVFDRQSGFLWECNEMSGLNKVLAA